MATTKARKQKKQPPTARANSVPPPEGEVFTLAEAAAYLRVPEEEVLRMVREQALPGRRVGADWRFLKVALRAWLGSPQPSLRKEDFWETQLGAFKDDPTLMEMVEEIYRRRGRPMTEEG